MSTHKSSAEFTNAAKKSGYIGVDSLVIMQLFKKELPVVFGRVKAGVNPDSPLPDFKTFEKFDTQVKTLPPKNALELRIRAKVKLLTTLA